MKKSNQLFMLLSLLTCIGLIPANAQNYHTKPVYHKNKTNLTAPKKAFVIQVGAALEERSAYANGYLFFNQTIYDAVFYELRGYYVRNYIVTAPPSKAVHIPSLKNEQNLNGVGIVGIVGYIFPIVQHKVFLMPFTRLQYFTNTSSAYKDSFGNKILSHVSTYFLGLKLNMIINEIVSMYLQYYAGYQRSLLTGRGYFSTTTDPILNQLTSTYELGFPYKITSSWTLSPYIQWVTTATNPNFTALNTPISNNGLTATTGVYAVKLAYNFN